MSRTSTQTDQPDPVFVSTRRDAIIVLAVFAVVCVWTVSWCYAHGYDEATVTPIVTVLGIPSWVFWGIAVPWLVADVFTIWFFLWHMQDEDFAEDVSDVTGEEPGSASHSAAHREGDHA